jgi:hypothetical protein
MSLISNCSCKAAGHNEDICKCSCHVFAKQWNNEETNFEKLSKELRKYQDMQRNEPRDFGGMHNPGLGSGLFPSGKGPYQQIMPNPVSIIQPDELEFMRFLFEHKDLILEMLDWFKRIKQINA